jgi:hypothetical protein
MQSTTHEHHRTNSALTDPVVSDATLRGLAAGDAQRALGEISDEDQAVLAMILPDICRELLTRRVAMRSGIA